MQRISNNSSNEKIFHEEAAPYKKALADSGYSLEPSQFEYTKTPANIKTKRNRRRKIMYFNPPFCKSVKTNVGKLFLDIVHRHFPTSSKMGKIFNKKI